MSDNTQRPVITNFVETFQCNYNFVTTDTWRDKIQNTNDLFHTFSFLSCHIINIIDSYIPCQTITIKNLLSLRKDTYNELNEFNILFNDNIFIDEYGHRTVDICFHTANL
jgi:hypothetical protein